MLGLTALGRVWRRLRLGRGRADERPDLRRIAHAGGRGGVWWRASTAGLEWLGAYTPEHVPMRIRKLMRRDPQIRLGLVAIKAPFFGIEYRAEGGTAETRELVEETLLRSSLFDPLLSSILNALDFGFQAHEIVWAIADVEIDPDGPDGLDPRPLPAAYVVRKLVDLDPEGVTLLADEWGDFAGVSLSAVDGTSADLPASKCLLSRFQSEHGRHGGQSVLDPAYNPWYWSMQLWRFLLSYLEQKGNPPLIGRGPSAPVLDEDTALAGQTPQDPLDVITSAGMELRGGGIAGLPSERDDKGNPLWDLQELAVSARKDEFLPVIQHLDDLKLRGVLVPERLVSQEGVGSYRMVDIHFDVFMGLMEMLRRGTVLPALTDLANRLVRVNHGRRARPVRVTSSPLSRQHKALLAEILQKTLEIPRTLEDGRTYTAGALVNVIKALEALNIPHHDPRQVAQAAVPITGVPTGAAAELAPEIAASPPPTPEELARYPDSAAAIGERYGKSGAVARAWARAGCPHLRMPGGGYRFDARAVHEWLTREPEEVES